MAGGSGDGIRVGQGGFGAGWDRKVFLKRISPCLCYAMSSSEFPQGQILSQSLLSLFLKSFAVGLIGARRLLLGQPRPVEGRCQGPCGAGGGRHVSTFPHLGFPWKRALSNQTGQELFAT